ncbi:MAG: rane protein [Paenibacillus sp.]|nr:rane protein [Paenibacillus sp.]
MGIIRRLPGESGKVCMNRRVLWSNGSLIGANANLIVAGMASKEGYPLRFTQFLKYGFPLMLMSIAISSVYVYLRYLV